VSWFRIFGNISPRALRGLQRDADVFYTPSCVNFIRHARPVLYVVAFGRHGALVRTCPYQGQADRLFSLSWFRAALDRSSFQA